jgi:hypothetical protein
MDPWPSPNVLSWACAWQAVVFTGHWIGCLWYFFGTEEWHDEVSLYPDGSEIQPWVTLYFGGAANQTGYGPKYVMSLYFSLMTITGVGYGDIYAQTPNEKRVALCAMMIGAVVFGLVIGSIGDLVAKSDVAGKQLKKKVANISAYLHDRHVPAALIKPIRNELICHY